MVNLSGVLKIIDLGSSRKIEKDGIMTPDMVTLRYRAPEIFLGDRHYTAAIDIWSAGAIFAELLTGKPVLDGTSELEQIDKMVTLLGSPSDKSWPGFDKLPHAKELIFPKQPTNRIRKFIPNHSDNTYDLLNKLLTYDPVSRISSTEALNHPYFSEEPLPAPMGTMPEILLLDNPRTGGGAAEF